MQAYEKASHPLSRKKIILNNFIGGIFWGLGSALGAILLIALLGFIVSKSDVFPVLGDFVKEVTRSMKGSGSQNQLPFTTPTPSLTPIPTSSPTPIPTLTPTPKSD